MVAEEADMFAQQGPDAGEVRDIDGDGGFAGVPEHVSCCIDVGEIVDFCEDGGDDLELGIISEWLEEQCVRSGRTTNVPMLKSRPRPIFCLSGRESEMIIGIGIAMMRRSLLMLKVAWTIAKCSSVVH